MIASLVVILPTRHEGGELVFRQQGEEFKFDPAHALKDALDDDDNDVPPVAYATFFSDVEHEVLEVRSGYRVTLTWNLYLVQDHYPDFVTAVTPFEIALTKAFQNLLDDGSFLPDGGYLGFGMRHEYPINDYSPDINRLFRSVSHVENSLKGSDAVLHKVCKNLSLRAKIHTVYTGFQGTFLCPGIAEIPYLEADELMFDLMDEVPDGMLRKHGGKDLYDDIDVTWITAMRPQHISPRKRPYLELGNEASIGFVYYTLVLIVTVGPAGSRTGASYV